ncbi:MAG: hypothetical protein EOP06_14475 [Proteobacteria bacterium]|nr:MAG: hypothetical protein EOP06_14475 [Pseudomonadota bacterium]
MRSGTCSARRPRILGAFGGDTSEDLLGMEKLKPGFLQSSADMVPGNSGGPLIDTSTCEIIGINSLTMNKDWQDTECVGSAFSTSIPDVIQELTRKRMNNYESFFACSSGAINNVGSDGRL